MTEPLRNHGDHGGATAFMPYKHRNGTARVNWIDLAVTSPLAIQSVGSESRRARDQWQRPAVTSQVNLSFSFVSRVHIHFIYFIAVDMQLTVRIVVSAIAVFRMVDSILSSSLQIVY